MAKKKKPKKEVSPTPKGLYAWNRLHAGSFLLYVEPLNDCYKFIFLPGPSDYYLTKDDFNSCIQTNTLEFVEPLPDDIYEETIKFSLTSPSNVLKLHSNIKS